MKPCLINTSDLNKDDLELIFAKAKYFKENYKYGEKFNDLKNITVAIAFFEPSTRTKLSFDLAAKRLSADILHFASAGSSITKGESLVDTIRTIDDMNVQMYIVRSAFSGVPQIIKNKTDRIVINAGDGKHEHPTQAILDAFTLSEYYGKIAGLNICIVGDIIHSRVARSNIFVMQTLGANVKLVAPGTLLPRHINPWNLEIIDSIDDAINWADALIVLRLQRERMESGILPSIAEFAKFYQITFEKFIQKDKIALMHPGPVNYGIELDYRISSMPNCLIDKQVTNGVFTRMAILSLLAQNLG